MKLIRKLKTKVKTAAARRRLKRHTKVARDIGKKAVKAGLVAGGLVAVQVAARELRARRGLRTA